MFMLVWIAWVLWALTAAYAGWYLCGRSKDGCKTSDRVMYVLWALALSYGVWTFGRIHGHDQGYTQGVAVGRDQILQEAVQAGAAALRCDSRTMEVEVLWVTKKEDRKEVQELYREGEMK